MFSLRYHRQYVVLADELYAPLQFRPVIAHSGSESECVEFAEKQNKIKYDSDLPLPFPRLSGFTVFVEL